MGKVAPDKRASNRASSQDEDLNRVRVFGCETKGGRPLVMEFVNVFVERTIVQSTVSPVMEEVLEHEEQEDLQSHLVPKTRE